MRTGEAHGSLWELAVLSLLREEPMHPYQMQRLLKERHKDDVLALKRGSLYHAIDRLLRERLIELVGVGREGRRPERTTYRITTEGEREHVRRLRQRIATPHDSPPEFVASLNFLVYLAPKDALADLELRAQTLELRTTQLGSTLAQLAHFLDRINRIESEYLLAAQQAELAWIRNLIAELRSGRFTWDLKKILKDAKAARHKTRKKGSNEH